MGNFKLGSDRPDVLKEKGFLNKSPFTANGNTMAYNNGETDPTKPAKGSSVQEQAEINAQNAPKIELKPGDPGYDPNKAVSWVQRGTATRETPHTPEGDEAYAKLSQEEKDAQDKKWKEIQSKNAEIFSYEDKKGDWKTDTEQDSTVKNVRIKNNVTADFIGDRMEKDLKIMGWKPNPEYGRGTDNTMSRQEIAAIMKERGIPKSLPIYADISTRVATKDRENMRRGSETEIGRTGWEDQQEIVDSQKLQELKKQL